MAKGRKTGGRKPGSKNKTTASIKDALIKAFDELGGVPRLVQWGKTNPNDFYKLWARLAPQEHTGADGGPIEHEHKGAIVWGSTEVPL